MHQYAVAFSFSYSNARTPVAKAETTGSIAACKSPKCDTEVGRKCLEIKCVVTCIIYLHIQIHAIMFVIQTGDCAPRAALCGMCEVCDRKFKSPLL